MRRSSFTSGDEALYNIPTYLEWDRIYGIYTYSITYMDYARRGSASINPLAAPCVISVFDWILLFPSAILFALLSSFALKP